MHDAITPPIPPTAEPTPERRLFALTLVAFALASVAWAVPTPKGAIPLATPLLALLALWPLADDRLRQRFSWSWSIALLIALVATGFFSAAAIPKGQLLRELAQFFEIFFLAAAVGAVIGRSNAAFRAVGIVAIGLTIANLAHLAGVSATGMSVHRSSVLVAALLPFAIVHLSRSRLATPVVAGISGLLVLLAGVPAVIAASDLSLLLPLIIGMATLALCRQRGALAGGLPVAVILFIVGCAALGATGLARFHGQFNADHRTRLAIEAQAAMTAPAKAPLGFGPGTYRESINTLRADISDMPHPAEMKVAKDSNSQFLVTLVEGGPLAAIAIALLLLFGASRAFSLSNPEDGAPAVAAALATLLVGALFATILGRGIGIAVGLLIGIASAIPVRHAATATTGFSRRLLPPLLAGGAAAVALGVAFAAPNANRKIAAILPFHPVAAPQLTIVNADGSTADNHLQITIEGEDYVQKTGGFDRMAANDVSGNMVLVLPDGSGKSIGYATYEVELPQAGQWQLVARVFWEDGCSNSLGFELLDQDARVSSELFNQWHELAAARPLSLPAGKITIRVNNIEDGVRLDWFRLRLQQ